jgi:hypothetical protein
MAVSQYSINGEFWPQPDSTSWADIANGTQLSTNLPVLSPYRRHTWNYPVLPDCDFTAMLEAIRNTELTSLTTDPPDSAEELVIYDEAKVIGITSTRSWGNPTGVSIEFEVYAP